MMMKYRGVIACFVIAAVLPSCKKEERTIPSGGAPWMGHIAVAVDSAFIMAPNIVTPNGDGINDSFAAIGRYVSSMQTNVIDADGVLVFSSQSLQPVWNDLDTTDLGRYHLHVSAVSFSGNLLAAQGYLYVMDYDANMCLQFQGDPVTGDQLDPRNFGESYPTNETFCP